MTVMLKFEGGCARATSCGSRNPKAAAIAMAMLEEANQFAIALTSEVESQATATGLVRDSGIQLG